MNIEKFQKLNDLIVSKNTGSVATLAEKLGVSQRTAKGMIVIMREFCGCNIKYNINLLTYQYTEEGTCDFRFRKSKMELITEELNKLLRKVLVMLPFACIVMEKGMDLVVFLPRIISDISDVMI